MTIESEPARQLSKNSIELFIVRFDLQPVKESDYQKIISDIKVHFDRLEKRSQTSFEVKFTNDKSEVNKLEDFDYVLVNEQKKCSMTFSFAQNFFSFETKIYSDRKTYSEIIQKVVTSATENKIELVAKRIGMRFINNFKCEKVRSISKFFNPDISKNIIKRASQPAISRVICQDEFINEGHRVRIQYGIPNKYYPAVINNYDLLLDIDSYDGTLQKIDNWSTVLSELNHSGYLGFINSINPKLLESLK